MGIHVGGIYVEANSKGITQKAVAEFIRNYWLKIGAKESERDPLQFKPLELSKTGLLGFAVTSIAKDEKGKQWIGIYDSERYTADPALARALSIHFEADVWFYDITDSVNYAYAKKYGKEEEEIKKYDKAIEKAESFPYTLLYFNQLTNLTEEERKDFLFLSFEDVPFRPKAKYSGPSPEQLSSNDLVIQAQQYVKSKNAEKLIKISDDHSVYYDVIHDVFDDTNLSDPEEINFIYKLAPMAIQKDNSFCSIAEAALRMKDEKMFEDAIKTIPQHRLYKLEWRAREILNTDPQISFRLIEAQIARENYSDTRILNNAIHFLERTAHQTDISAKRLNTLLEKAYKAGPQNPGILHNLACVYVKMKLYDKALQCVEDAVKYGYNLIDKLKNDVDLKPIQSDERFKKAFEQKPTLTSLDHLKMVRRVGKKEVAWITPAIGLHLYFKKDEARTGAADLLEQLYKEFPEMFSYYLPSGHVQLSPTSKGKVKRDMTTLRKGKAPYGYDIYYNALEDGGAADQRILIDLYNKHDGEVSICLPIDLAKQPEELYTRLINYANLLPFEVGSAGYSFSVQYEGNGCDAAENLLRLLESYWGFTTGQKSLHCMPNAKFIIPNWLTFLNAEQAQKVDLKKLPSTCIQTLPNRGIVIRAAEKPFIGLSTNPNDLDLLPQVIQALEPILPKESLNNEIGKLQIDILNRIKTM